MLYLIVTDQAVCVLRDLIKTHNEALTRQKSNGCTNTNLKLEEEKAHDILGNVFDGSRKAKSILMSLCFFRGRMTLQMNETRHFIFPMLK